MIRFYLTPFLDSGEFGSEIEISKDVDLGGIGKIKRSLDNSDFDIGVLKYNSLTLKLMNRHGKYSDVDNVNSIFRWNRSGSKIRVTWAPAENAICGIVVCGEALLSEEVVIYRGILNDEASAMGVADQIINFQVLSYDSLFSKVIVPFSALDSADFLSEILFKILNQTQITKYIVVDIDNIDLDLDYVPNSLAWFENKTGKEAIEKLLLASNSIVFIENLTLKSSGRAPGAAVAYSFFGQASDIGIENIIDIEGFRNGQNRILNFVRWKDGLVSDGSSSVLKWGVRLKEIDIEFVTDAVKQAQTSTRIVNEFKNPKREFSISAPANQELIALPFLSRVDIDYPSIVESTGQRLPVVGLTPIGDESAPLPYSLWDFTLTQDEKFKVMGIEMDLKKEILSFQLRAI